MTALVLRTLRVWPVLLEEQTDSGLDFTTGKSGFLVVTNNLPASVETLSKISLMKEFMIDIPFLDIPVSGWTCFKTL